MSKLSVMNGFCEKVILISTGIVTGLINGIFGGGGGMIVVPMLVFLLGLENKKAHATAILIILPVSLLSGIIYASFGAFKVDVGIWVTIGVIAGGIIGAFLLKKLPQNYVAIIFSAVMLIAGIKMLFF